MIKGKLILGILLVGLISFWGVSPVYSNQRVSIDDARDEDTLHYDQPNNIGIGNSNLTHYRAAVRFTPWEIAVPGTLIAVIFYHYEPMAHSGSLYVHQESTQVEPFTAIGVGWHRIDLSPPYAYNDSMDLWIAIEIFFNPDEYPIGVDPGPAIDFRGDWISLDYGQSWAELQSYNLDYNWNIRAIVHREGGGIEEKILNQQQRVGLGIHPNPCRVTTKINLGTTQDTEDIKLRIYDAKGCLVKTFYNVTELPFDYVMWHGEDNYDRKLPCGVYFVLLQTPQYIVTKEVILLK
ncbi:MAG: T9SS type A sorting domain-containing protein [bacterium]